MEKVLLAVSKGSDPFDEFMKNWYELSDSKKDGLFDMFREVVADELGDRLYMKLRLEAGRRMIKSEFYVAVEDGDIAEEDAEHHKETIARVYEYVKSGESTHESYLQTETAVQSEMLLKAIRSDK